MSFAGCPGPRVRMLFLLPTPLFLLTSFDAGSAFFLRHYASIWNRLECWDGQGCNRVKIIESSARQNL